MSIRNQNWKTVHSAIRQTTKFHCPLHCGWGHLLHYCILSCSLTLPLRSDTSRVN